MEEKFSSSPSLRKKSARRRHRCPPLPKPAPWLVFQHGKGHAFYNPCEARTFTKHIPELSGSFYWQKPCHQGWLVIMKVDDKACFLWNPVSMESVKFPNLIPWFMDYHFDDCVLTLSMSNNIKESTVFFLLNHRTTSEILLIYSQPFSSSSYIGLYPRARQWRSKRLNGYFEDLNPFLRSLNYLKGKLYILCCSDWHLEIELKQQQTISIRRFRVEGYPLLQHAAGSTTSQISHHVESFDDIFRVNIFFSERNMNKPRAPVSAVQVWRLDFSLMAWIEVKSLGDDVLFIGGRTRAYCSAADMALKRGCVFYTVPKDKSLYIFELEDDGITVVSPFSKLPTPCFSGDWIMIPRDDKVEDGEIIELERKLNKSCLGDSCDEADQDKIRNGGESEEVERPPWPILSNDIVELIASYLNPKDYVRFHCICRTNRSIFPEVYTPRSSSFPLLVFNSFEDNTCTIYNFVDPMHNEIFSMKKNHSELLVGATIRFSKYGWLLLMSKDMKTPFFYNPFTKVMIRLPDFPNFGRRLYLSGMSFSSSPTSPDCVVFAIQPIVSTVKAIYAIKRGSCDWRSRVIRNIEDSFVPCFNNPVFFQCGFFCLEYGGTLGRCSVNDEGNNNGLDWEVGGEHLRQFNKTFPSYLVECNGNLLLVNVGPLGETVGVFSLDMENKVWVEVKNLGKHMLFISNTSSFSAVAPPNSRMENRVYFPRLHKDGRGLLFYSLDTGRYHYSGAQENDIDAATDFFDTKEMCNSTWIEPDWSQSSITADPTHWSD